MERRDFIRKALACGGAAGLSVSAPKLGTGGRTTGIDGVGRSAGRPGQDRHAVHAKDGLGAGDRRPGDPRVGGSRPRRPHGQGSRHPHLRGRHGSARSTTIMGSPTRARTARPSSTRRGSRGTRASRRARTGCSTISSTRPPRPRTAPCIISTTGPRSGSIPCTWRRPFLAVAGRPDEAMKQIEGFRKLLWNAEQEALLAYLGRREARFRPEGVLGRGKRMGRGGDDPRPQSAAGVDDAGERQSWRPTSGTSSTAVWPG